MIWVLLWMLIGLGTGVRWVYLDVVEESTVYNLKQLLGMTAISAIFGPILIGFYIHDRYGEQINGFFEKPVIGGKK